jgi:hypothetical protein
LKFKGIDAKFDKPVQLLNASVPAGVGILFHSSGAVPVNAFVVELILYKLVNVVTFVLFVNCNTFVNTLQFLNVPEKVVTLVFKSNNVDGTDVKPEHAKKQDAKDVTNGTLSNNPVGTVVIVGIDENALLNDVAFGEKSKISAGIAVILVPFIKFVKLSTSAKPVYPPTPLKDALPGIAVKFKHP